MAHSKEKLTADGGKASHYSEAVKSQKSLGGPKPAWKNSVRCDHEEAGGECVDWCCGRRPSACEGKLASTVHLPLFSRGLSVSTELMRQASKSGSLLLHSFT